jgi:excisionase family DNA binding protein
VSAVLASASQGEEDLVTDSIERPLVYTVTHTATLLGISRTHAYELVARGDLAHVRLGRRIVVPRQSLERLLDAAG